MKAQASFQATLHCLTGCAIGEVLGMVIASATGISNGASIILATLLAFTFGYALTLRPLFRHGLSFRQAAPIALAADTVSITVMEIVDNGIVAVVPGALEATLSQSLFWWSLALGLAIAFFAAWPVNHLLISRGRGHAVAHQHHH